MISIERQFSVFVDNRPGTLARACQALAKEGVNILALSISDTIDDAVVRFVVDDKKKAATALNSLHLTVHERDVIFMELPNQPGILATVAQKLAAAGINIEYAYCTSSTVAGQPGRLVLRPSDIEGAISALS